jgi:DNA-directed RNA polymerase beta' subunit
MSSDEAASGIAAIGNSVKPIKYLEALQKEGMRPHEAYLVSKVPVVPPVFRPILPQPNDPSMLMVSDANKLYGHLMDSNHTLRTTAVESDRGKHRRQVFNAVAALYGTEDVENDELRGQSVKGFLSNIAGVGTPKGGFFQRKLMRRTQDVSGRGTAVPDANLGMDHVGLPEQMLWQMYDKLIVARLVRTGYPALDARERVNKKDHVAREALLAETKERPVLINRAPTLHRWSIVAAHPVPVQGKTIRVNPFIEKGMNLDYDGDTLQVHVPVTHDAIEEARHMTLSNMLLSDQSRRKLMAFPQHEAIIGFTHASTARWRSRRASTRR